MLEIELKQELLAIGHAISIELLDERGAKVTDYLQDIQTGIDALNNTIPQSSEELCEIFLLTKKIVDALVEKVKIDKGRTLHVCICLNLLRFLEGDANKGGPIGSAVAIEKAGIYTRKPTSPAHCRLREVCALPSQRAFR